MFSVEHKLYRLSVFILVIIYQALCLDDRRGTCELYSNEETNHRGLKRLKFASSNDHLMANTFGSGKAFRMWTWHHPQGQHKNQINYILVQKLFHFNINITRRRSSDYDLLVIIFRLYHKKINNSKGTRFKLDHNKLKYFAIVMFFSVSNGISTFVDYLMSKSSL